MLICSLIIHEVSYIVVITLLHNHNKILSDTVLYSYLLASCYLVPEGEKQQMHISVSVPAPDTADSQTSG